MYFINFPLCQIWPKATGSEQQWFSAVGQICPKSARKKSHPFFHEGRVDRRVRAFRTPTGCAKIFRRRTGCLSGDGASEQRLMVRKLGGSTRTVIACIAIGAGMGKVHIHSHGSSSEEIS